MTTVPWGQSRRTGGSRRTGRSERSRGSVSEGATKENTPEADVEFTEEGPEVTIGYERAGFGVELTVGGGTAELTLGIGVASVTLDLNDPNNSSVSYAFGIYEIEGERDGCTLTLEYKIAGQLAKTEVRTIPECEGEEREDPPPPGVQPPKPPEPDPETPNDDEGWGNFDEHQTQKSVSTEIIFAVKAPHSRTRFINLAPTDPFTLWACGGDAIGSANYVTRWSSELYYLDPEDPKRDIFLVKVRRFGTDQDIETATYVSEEPTSVMFTRNFQNGIVTTVETPYGNLKYSLTGPATSDLVLGPRAGVEWFVKKYSEEEYDSEAGFVRRYISTEPAANKFWSMNRWQLFTSSVPDVGCTFRGDPGSNPRRRDAQMLGDYLELTRPKRQEKPLSPPPFKQTDKQKKKMDCCKKILKLIASDQYPVKVPKRWIDRRTKNPEFDPKDAKTYEELKTITDVMFTIGMMLDRFEELFNPAGEESAFPLKADQANWLARMMGVSGGNYKYPDPDDDRKPEENRQIKPKDLPINGYMDIFRYLLESQIRLENVLPYAEMSDSEIEKRLLWPKHQGTQKLHNLLQVQEALFLYLNNVIGDPTQPIIVKDSNPAIEGDQPLTTEFFNLSDIARKTYRMNIDTAQDVDLGNNFAKRSLYELLIIHQTIVTVHEMCEAIMEDLDFKEIQEMIQVPMAADPYAGRRNDDGTFTPDEKLDENTEEAVEENLDLFLRQSLVNVKVSRKDPAETTSLRDLVAQIGRYAAEAAAANKLAASPEAIQAAIDAARAAVQTQSALTRLDVQQALTGGRYRQKKRKNR